MASRRLCVRLLSGATVYEGPCPHSLAELRDKVAAAMGCERKDELVFCSGDAVLDCIEDAGEEITAVRDQVVGFLKEFMWHAYKDELPVRLWPAREHRRLILVAVEINGCVPQHASVELRADRDVVLAAVTAMRGEKLPPSSGTTETSRDVVMAAVASNRYALQYASPELRADRGVVMGAVANDRDALVHASAEFRADRNTHRREGYICFKE